MLLALPYLHYMEGLSKEGLVRGIRRLAFGVLFMLGLLNPIAQAAPGYVDGNDVPVWQICPITNISAIASQNKVGFFTDPSTSYPKTGDVGYVRAVGSNISPCTNDTIGFDFFLPDGATLAIDSTNRVRCYAIKFTTPETALMNLQANIDAAFGASSSFKALTDQDRQKLYEAFVLMATLPLLGYTVATEQNDTRLLETYREVAGVALESALGVRPDRLRFTATGLELRR